MLIMYHIRNNAEQSVRTLLRSVVERLGTNELSAVDYLDDGSPVRVCALLLPYLILHLSPSNILP